MSCYDIDGNGVVDALTDGILVIRYLLGFNDADLIADVIGTGATRTTAADIRTYIESLIPVVAPDVAGDNVADDALPSQIITTDPENVTASVGENFTVHVNYDTSDGDNTLAGLHMGVCWDSTKVECQAIADILTTNANVQYHSQPVQDKFNIDGDSATDKVIYLSWLNFSGNWPNVQLPASLFSIEFKALENTDGSEVHFVAKESAHGYRFLAKALGLTIDDLNRYAAWVKEQFGDGVAPELSAPQADADNDGIPNLLEYLFGGNPLSREETLERHLQQRLERVGDENHVILSYLCRRAGETLRHEIQHSADLTQWDTATPLTDPTVEPVGTDFDRITLHFKQNPTGTDYFRLKVIQD